MRFQILGPALFAVGAGPRLCKFNIGEDHETRRSEKDHARSCLRRSLEPCIKFWTERMGFQKTVEVPEGNKIGFVILEKNGLELMYQSFASVEKDNPATAAAVRKGPTFLYIEVADLELSAVRDEGSGSGHAGADDLLPRQRIRN